jgi:hypothetical protein
MASGPPLFAAEESQQTGVREARLDEKMPGQARHFSFVTAAKIERAANDRALHPASPVD